jgi:hypothetical protein
MKAKTLIACALTAAALPLAPALAQNAEPSGPQGTGGYGARLAQNAEPSGPQGTGAYGARSGAIPQAVAPTDPYATQQSARPAQPYSSQEPRQPVRGRGSYDGPSWETNPPAPPA